MLLSLVNFSPSRLIRGSIYLFQRWYIIIFIHHLSSTGSPHCVSHLGTLKISIPIEVIEGPISDIKFIMILIPCWIIVVSRATGVTTAPGHRSSIIIKNYSIGAINQIETLSFFVIGAVSWWPECC